jgi:tetratricopeptide (TPR) repeat protein
MPEQPPASWDFDLKEIEGVLRRACLRWVQGDAALGFAVVQYFLNTAGRYDEGVIEDMIASAMATAGVTEINEPGNERDFLQQLLDQSRDALRAGDLSLACVGFHAGSLRVVGETISFFPWMVVGHLAALIRRGDTAMAADVSMWAIGVPPEQADRKEPTVSDSIKLLFDQIAKLRGAGPLPEIETAYALAVQLMASLDDTTSNRLQMAGTQMSRGENLIGLDRREEAEALHAHAQSIFDTLPDGHRTRLNRAMVRFHRGQNLEALRRLRDAEASYAAAVAVFATVPESGPDIARYKLDATFAYAECLSLLGRFEQAETVYRDAETLLSSLAQEKVQSVPRAPGPRTTLSGRKRKGARQKSTSAAELSGRPLVHPKTAARASNMLCLGWLSDAESYFRHIRNTEPEQGLADEIAGYASRRALQAVRLQSEGRHAEAEPFFIAANAMFDLLPETEQRNFRRAYLKADRGENLWRLGLYEEAEDFLLDAQTLFDQLPISQDVMSGRAKARTRRARNLVSVGQHAQAEALYVEAQTLYDLLAKSRNDYSDAAQIRGWRANNLYWLEIYGPDRPAMDPEALYEEAERLFEQVPLDSHSVSNRAGVLVDHASYLLTHGRAKEASEIYRTTDILFESLPDNPAFYENRAIALLNHASSYRVSAEHDKAEIALGRAQQLFDSLSDSDATNAYRFYARVARTSNFLESGQVEEATRLWHDSHDILARLIGHLGSNIPAMVKQHVGNLFLLAQGTDMEPDVCERLALDLFNWALDWVDLTSDPSGTSVLLDEPVVNPDAVAPMRETDLDSLFGACLAWCVDRERYDAALRMLGDLFGRYAAAERVLSAGRGQDAGSSEIHRLRVRLRAINGSIQVLGEHAGAPEPAADSGDAREALWQQRSETITQLLGKLREEQGRQAAGMLDTVSIDRVQAGLQGPAQTNNRADSQTGRIARGLVVLCRVNAQGTARHARAIALVFKGDDSPVRVIELPSIVRKTAAFTRVFLSTPHGNRQALEPMPGKPVRGTYSGGSAAPDGAQLRAAVDSGWELIDAELDGMDEVFVAVHQELGHLPWQAVDTRYLLRVFHSVRLAVSAMDRSDSVARIAPPDESLPLGVLAHSPASFDPAMEEVLRRSGANPIPGVYADRHIACASWPAVEIISDKDTLLGSSLSLIQLSCHGDARKAYTGKGHLYTTAFEFERKLTQRMRALLTIACSSGQAGTNGFGESGGWSAVLSEKVDVTLAALYPVADRYCPLFVLLLHRAWRQSADLRTALADTRMRLRSGQWADSADQEAELARVWTDAVRVSRETEREQEPEQAHNQMPMDAPETWVASCLTDRKSLYETDEDFRLVAEAFVIFG